MNMRSKYLAVLMVWITIFFLLGFGVWQFQAGELMLIIYLLAGMLGYIGYAFLFRCGSCGTPVLLKPMVLFGMDLYRWTILPPIRCRACGKTL
jgi:hypothetical protein